MASMKNDFFHSDANLNSLRAGFKSMICSGRKIVIFLLMLTRPAGEARVLIMLSRAPKL